MLNALAALAACREAGVPFAEAALLLTGLHRRGRCFEEHGATAAGARVFDDYAHHPTEVRPPSTPRGPSAPAGDRRFQPHLFSRTRMLARQFGEALALADVVAVLDVYPAARRPRTSWA